MDPLLWQSPEQPLVCSLIETGAVLGPEGTRPRPRPTLLAFSSWSL